MTITLLDRHRGAAPQVDDDATRRQFLAGLAATGLFVACGSGDQPSATGPGDDPTWSFTDDRGVTVELPSTPRRLAMQEDVAGALLSYGMRPTMVFGNAPIADSPQFEGVGLDGIEEVGTSFGVINLERLASLRPDVILVPWSASAPDDVTWMGFEDRAQADQVASIAPLVAVNVTDLAYSDMMPRFQRLAEALGADTGTDAQRKMLESFEQARQAVRAAAAAAPDIKVMAVSPTPELMYIARPARDNELREYAALGVEIYSHAAAGEFEEVSWERMPERPADVYLVDSRLGFVDLDFLAEHPIWTSLPAVQAGQVGRHFLGTVYRIPLVTALLQELAELISQAENLVA